MSTTAALADSMRLDKWLWCARFYKTRSLAVEEIGKGRVTVNGQAAKAARELRVGDNVALRQGPVARTVIVRALSSFRGPAPVAQQLYEETPESIAARAQAAEQHLVNKGLGAQAGQRVVERQDHHLVESAHAQLRQLVAQRAHAGRGQFGLAQHLGKVVARVRLERHRATGQAALGGLGPQQPHLDVDAAAGQRGTQLRRRQGSTAQVDSGHFETRHHLDSP